MNLCNRTQIVKFHWLIKQACKLCTAQDERKKIIFTTWQLYNRIDVKWCTFLPQQKQTHNRELNHFAEWTFSNWHTFPKLLFRFFGPCKAGRNSITCNGMWLYLQRFWQLGRYVKRLERTFWLFVFFYCCLVLEGNCNWRENQLILVFFCWHSKFAMGNWKTVCRRHFNRIEWIRFSSEKLCVLRNEYIRNTKKEMKSEFFM